MKTRKHPLGTSNIVGANITKLRTERKIKQKDFYCTDSVKWRKYKFYQLFEIRRAIQNRYRQRNLYHC